MAQLLRAGGIIFLLLIQQAVAITLTSPRSTYSRRNGTSVTAEPSGEKIEEQCVSRLENGLYSKRANRRNGESIAGATPLDLNGYALHQALRTAPYDMYLTDMRVRAPPKWARVDKCRFDPLTGTLQARLAFRDLSVTGKVKLYSEKLFYLVPPVERCNMTLRMRQAGVGFTVRPGADRALGTDRSTPRRTHVHTAATFVEPQFISVHSYGCESNPGGEVVKRTEGPGARSPSSRVKKLDDQEPRAEMSQEMEEVFIRGVRSLLVRYMEHQMEPALKDTLMTNLDSFILDDEEMPMETTESSVPTTLATSVTTALTTEMLQEPMNNSIPEQLTNSDNIRANRITFYDVLGFKR